MAAFTKGQALSSNGLYCFCISEDMYFLLIALTQPSRDNKDLWQEDYVQGTMAIFWVFLSSLFGYLIGLRMLSLKLLLLTLD